jgi:hypothetical protein
VQVAAAQRRERELIERAMVRAEQRHAQELELWIAERHKVAAEVLGSRPRTSPRRMCGSAGCCTGARTVRSGPATAARSADHPSPHGGDPTPMTGRRRLDQFDDGVRVTDPQGRPIRGRTEWERAVLREARRMRAAWEVVGHVDPTPLADALDLDQVDRLAAHLRAVLTEIGAAT